MNSTERELVLGILGVSVTSGNRGVTALATSLLNLCLEVVPNAEVRLLLNHDRHEMATFRVGGTLRAIPVVPARLSPWCRPTDHLFWIVFCAVLYRLIPWTGMRRAVSRSIPWIHTLEMTALVGDIRGGDSFSDLYGLRRFITGFLLAWSVILVKGSLVQFPQTYGPYRSRLARGLAAYLLRRSSLVIARDLRSQREVQKLLPAHPRVWVCPDVAFSLEAVVPESVNLKPAPKPEDRNAHELGMPRPIGVNVNGLMYNGGYTRNNMFGLACDYREMLPRLISRLATAHAGEIWLVPHAFAPSDDVESDPEACRNVRAGLPPGVQKRVRIVAGEYDCHELKGIIGKCDFFVGSRMHSCIAALSQGIPCVGVAYSQKFAGVFETVGMSDWVIDARAVTEEQAITRVLELYRQRDMVRGELSRRADQARQDLKAIFARLVQVARNQQQFSPTRQRAAVPANAKATSVPANG